jgi:hypothetical protein
LPGQAAFAAWSLGYDDLEGASYVSQVQDGFRQIHFLSRRNDDRRIEYLPFSGPYRLGSRRDLDNVPTGFDKMLLHAPEIFLTDKQDFF